MADAVVSFAIENVGNFLIQEGKFLYGVRDQVEEMQRELKRMQCFLKDAERRKGESDMVRNWVSEIREATYDVEDVVEHFFLKSALRNQAGFMNRINKYAFSINHGVELHRAGSRIESIKTKLSNLRNSLQSYGIRELGVGGEEAAISAGIKRKRQDYAHTADHNVVGLDKKITELVLHLLDTESASVVCVYGMGGLGKTTTAKQVYTDPRVRGHFDSFAFVYISQQFSQRQVWESILIQLSGKSKEGVENMSNDELASQLCHLQKESKCLIVVDDVWQNQDWDNLSAAFFYMERDCRSKILVTSRNGGVVSHGVYCTSLDILDETTSFMLLKNTILFFGGPNHPMKESSELDKCAKTMVKECGGLPLAITVLGGILATKHELTKWERVGTNIKLVLKRGDQKGNGGVTRVLESSFEDLPYHLKLCFLHFSMYGEDEEIKTTKLIQRWIGEGFVPASMEEGDETMEDVGEEYLNELVSRCMIQVGARSHTGKVKTCRIHDLVREMCISKAREEGFAHSIKLDPAVGNDYEGTDFDKSNCRRLSVYLGGSSDQIGVSISSSIQDICTQIRSISFHVPDGKHGTDKECELVELMAKKLKLVRVLDVTNPPLSYHSIRKSLRGTLQNLIHLRYLKTDAAMLPASVGDFRCLQTLDLYIKFCDKRRIIPDSIWGMEQLRHLYLPIHGECESSKQQVGNFRNLQTLVNFPPEKFDLQQNLAKFTSVRKLVTNHRIEKIDEIIRSRGILFNRLQSLSTTAYDLTMDNVMRASPRLYRLVARGCIKFQAPCSSIWPSSLTKLVLQGSALGERDMSQLAKLKNLKVLLLELDAFTGGELVFHENDFPQLHHLKLKELKGLVACMVHEGALPCFSSLKIVDCRRLESVPKGFEFLKQLKELKVKNMPLAFKKRVEQGGEDWDRVNHVPSVSFSKCDLEQEKMANHRQW